MGRGLWIRTGVSLAAGLVGMLLALGAAHLYTDHQNLHALVNLVQQAQPKK